VNPTTGRKRIVRRRICWPNPDATCLEGGCSYCDAWDFRSIREIREYAAGAGTVPNRGNGEQLASEAFQRGLDNDFYGRVQVRRRA
jgi:hypothetical protein